MVTLKVLKKAECEGAKRGDALNAPVYAKLQVSSERDGALGTVFVPAEELPAGTKVGDTLTLAKSSS
jgi:hypothetical protein